MAGNSAFSRMSDRGKTLVVAGVLVLLVVLLLGTAEGLVRVRQYLKYGTGEAIDDLYVIDAASGLRIPRPGARTARITINSLGFRGPEITREKAPGVVRIAYLGASTTYCADVSGDDAVWTQIIDAELARRFPHARLEFVNGGVPGYSVESSIHNLDRRVAPLRPDIVVIYHATNDLSSEMREIAESQGVTRTNLAREQSWLARYSLLWKLVEMNLGILRAQRQADARARRIEIDTRALGAGFRSDLLALVEQARAAGAKRVVLATFAVQLRDGQTKEQLRRASESAVYYMPFMTPAMLIEAYARYNEIIGEVAARTGALLVGGETDIPGDPRYFHDTVHFTDAGSRAQAARMVEALVSDPVVSALLRDASR